MSTLPIEAVISVLATQCAPTALEETAMKPGPPWSSSSSAVVSRAYVKKKN